MKSKFIKSSVLLPIAIGMLFGTMLFWIGYTQDGPGACVIGLDLAFGLLMLAFCNAGIIEKGFLTPILLFCYGAEVVFLSIILFFDGEFEDLPHLFFAGLALGILMLVIGTLSFRRRKECKKYE